MGGSKKPRRKSDVGSAIQEGAKLGALSSPPDPKPDHPMKPVQRKPGVRKHPLFWGKRNPYRRA